VLKSRKKAVLVFLVLIIASITLFFRQGPATSAVFYAICAALGFSGGYWAIFVTVAAEQFGTNLRATVATTVPNFVRGMVVPITMLFKYTKEHFGLETGAIIVGVICIVLAFASLFALEETFHKDLDYFEEFM
jgi:energy-coupling factor transporter transmembrane protein EcfT